MCKMLLAMLAATMACGSAEAAYTVTYTEVPGEVVANGSGTLKVSGLTRDTRFDGGPMAPFIEPSASTQLTGSSAFKAYDVTLTGPGAWGSKFGPFDAAGSGDGIYLNAFGVVLGDPSSGIIGVPVNYVSGALLNSTAIYAGQTFASLGLNAGTYVYSYGTGANADTFTVQIGPKAVVIPDPVSGSVPEPASWTMMIAGFCMIGTAMRRHARTSVGFV